MADSHFSDFRDRSSHSRSSSQSSDRSSGQFHSRFSSRQFQQIVEFDIRFLKLSQSAKNRFFIIEENFEYINDCLEQYIEERIEDQVLWKTLRYDFEFHTEKEFVNINSRTWNRIYKTFYTQGIWLDKYEKRKTRPAILHRAINNPFYGDWTMDQLTYVENTYNELSKNCKLRKINLLAESATRDAFSQPTVPSMPTFFPPAQIQSTTPHVSPPQSILPINQPIEHGVEQGFLYQTINEISKVAKCEKKLHISGNETFLWRAWGWQPLIRNVSSPSYWATRDDWIHVWLLPVI